MKKEKEITVIEETINCSQALNHFKLIERNRRVAAKKFVGQEHTVADWESLWKQDKLIK